MVTKPNISFSRFKEKCQTNEFEASIAHDITFFVFLRLIVTYNNHDCGGNLNLMKSVVMISSTDFQIRSSSIGSVYISGKINFLLLCTHTKSVRALIYLCRYFIALFWQALSQCSCSLMKRISPFGRLPNCQV